MPLLFGMDLNQWSAADTNEDTKTLGSSHACEQGKTYGKGRKCCKTSSQRAERIYFVYSESKRGTWTHDNLYYRCFRL